MDKNIFYNIVDSAKTIGQCFGPFFWLVSKVEQMSPHIIIEIGTGEGGTLRVWERIIDAGDLVISIDIRPDVDRLIQWNYKNSDRQIILTTGDSTDSNIVKLVEQTLAGRKADFLFIDGGHTYEIVSKDFRNYIPFVRIGGLVGFHDLSDILNVGKFFEELKGDKDMSRSWMRMTHSSDLQQLPEKVGNDKFMKDLKEILIEKGHLVNDGQVCTGIWWKS